METEKCNDPRCCRHGRISIRGRSFIGVVTSAKAAKTVSVEWISQRNVPKYERYEKIRSSVKAHLPPCSNVKEGDIVKVTECRPLSKTKSFVVVEKMGVKKGFTEKQAEKEAVAEGKKDEGS